MTGEYQVDVRSIWNHSTIVELQIMTEIIAAVTEQDTQTMNITDVDKEVFNLLTHSRYTGKLTILGELGTAPTNLCSINKVIEETQMQEPRSWEKSAMISRGREY